MSAKVKPLTWRRGYRDEHVTIEQMSFGGLYQVRVLDGVVNLDWPDHREPLVFSSVDEAKAAAQADYEARILAALEPAPEVGQEAVSVLAAAMAAKHSDVAAIAYGAGAGPAVEYWDARARETLQSRSAPRVTVTDEMVEFAQLSYERGLGLYGLDDDDMRAALEAALSSGKDKP